MFASPCELLIIDKIVQADFLIIAPTHKKFCVKINSILVYNIINFSPVVGSTFLSLFEIGKNYYCNYIIKSGKIQCIVVLASKKR